MNDEHVATYIYDPFLDYGVYDIYAVYDSRSERNRRNVSYYNVHDKKGRLVNEGEPLYQMPTWQEVFDKYYIVEAN
jgi:hypothetical protein